MQINSSLDKLQIKQISRFVLILYLLFSSLLFSSLLFSSLPFSSLLFSSLLFSSLLICFNQLYSGLLCPILYLFLHYCTMLLFQSQLTQDRESECHLPLMPQLPSANSKTGRTCVQQPVSTMLIRERRNQRLHFH